MAKKKKPEPEAAAGPTTEEAEVTAEADIEVEGSDSDFGFELGDDFFADALAAVEKREQEARERTEREPQSEDGEVVLLFEEPPPETSDATKALIHALREDADGLRAQLEGDQASLAKERRRRELLEEDLRDSMQALQRAESGVRELRTLGKQLQRRLAQAQSRAERDVEQAEQFSHERLVEEILPVLDNLHLAAQQTREGANLDQVLQGVELIRSSFHQALANIDVTQVDASHGTPFDPNIHEAMMRVPRDDLPDMTILEEIRPGFLLHGRLMRAARVAVSSGGPPAVTEPDPTEDNDDA